MQTDTQGRKDGQIMTNGMISLAVALAVHGESGLNLVTVKATKDSMNMTRVICSDL